MKQYRITRDFFLAVALWTVALSVMGVGCAKALEEKGPMRVPNRFPPHLMFLTPTGASPLPNPAGRLDIAFSMDYTSVFVNENTKGWKALMDMEMTAIDLSMEYGLTDRLSFLISLPFVSMNSGFLDPFLADFHSTFGLPNYGRKHRPNDEFAYEVAPNDQPWFTGRSGGMHLTDSTLSVKWSLFGHQDTDRISGSLMYTLKLPTGDIKYGFGSGAYDHGLFFLSRYRLNPVTIYANPCIIAISDPKTDGFSIPVNTAIYGLLLAGEYNFSPSTAVLVQLNYYTSPFKVDQIDQLGDDSLQLVLGFYYAIASNLDLEFSFSEDLSESVPDFTVYTRLSYAIDI